MKTKTNRKYNVSDAKLIQLADFVYNTASLHITELSDFGVDSVLPDALKAKRTAFEDFATDEEYSADILGATQSKKNERKALLQLIRQITGRVKIQLGEEDLIYCSFQTGGLSRMREEDLCRTGFRVATVVNDSMDQLAVCGITPEILASIQARANAYNASIDFKKLKIFQRDFATHKRIITGNELYDAITYICALGKLCFQDVSQARYNQYVIYSNSTTTQTLEGEVAEDLAVNLSATGIKDSTDLTITNTGTSPLSFYFAEDPSDITGEKAVELKPGAVLNIKAADLGFDSKKANRLNVYNPGGEGKGKYKVEYKR